MSDVVHLHPVHPDRPEIAGKVFCELHGLSFDQINTLAARGMVFLTEFEWAGSNYGANIVARDWDHAVEIAAARPYGETVVGMVGEVFGA